MVLARYSPFNSTGLKYMCKYSQRETKMGFCKTAILFSWFWRDIPHSTLLVCQYPCGWFHLFHAYRRTPVGSVENHLSWKLHMILSNPTYEHIITWLPHRCSWRILQPGAFEEEAIPLIIQHGRKSSFARQLMILCISVRHVGQ